MPAVRPGCGSGTVYARQKSLARLPMLVVCAQTSPVRNTARFRFLTRSHGTLVAFRKNALKRPKKPSAKKIKKENENEVGTADRNKSPSWFKISTII